MYELAIIGAGQVGSRHLQALARLRLPCEISVVDPSPSSLRTARVRFEEMPGNPAITGVSYNTSIKTLPRILDYVIVATTADVRLQVLESLLGHSKVASLLLEKVLFQRLDEYDVATSLLETHQVQAWVNCVNRAYPVYAEIREFFANEPLRYFQVRGGHWGLGCNGIHYLDIFGMLAGALPVSISTAYVDKALIPSKRANFQEFTGVLRGGFAGGADFEMASVAGSTARLQLSFRSDNRSCVFDEMSGAAVFFDANAGGTWESRQFKMPYLSEVGTTIATEILTRGTCELTTYQESLVYHLPFIKALGLHAAACSNSPSDICPIT